MDQDERIFAELETLERGARRCRPPTQYDDHGYSVSDQYSYDERAQSYPEAVSRPHGQYRSDDSFNGDPAMRSSLDELRYSVSQYNEHTYHDLENQHRSPPTSTESFVTPGDATHAPERRPGQLNLSRYAYDDGKSSSYLRISGQPSSSAFNASQRQLPPPDRDSRPPAYGNTMRQHQGPSNYARNSERDHGEAFREDASNPSRRNGANPFPQAPIKAARAPDGPPVVQGIPLVSTRELPDRFRSIFPFPLFNAVQSKSFETVFRSNDNFVLSSPTGCGKTAVLELAICRLINSFANGTYKIVYQAPTKSLCSERQRDWQSKFGPLDVQVAELTGDTEQGQLRNAQHATIIVTTPEKWDSMTRKWKDHQKLMNMVKLFLIDEVHILKEDRGATLEAVVSRMKSIGSDVRFVALSATIPNLHDIAAWLGKNPMNSELPAPREKFGEEFRPVKLQKHVCGYQGGSNDFGFDKTLNTKLSDVIAKWSQRKPIMIFCVTRASCVETAKLLAHWWASKGSKDRYWTAPRSDIVVESKDLRDTISSGVAIHHGGLSAPDRMAVEKGYLQGEINVICCTSTLAVGVNLPCHMVIIKGTVGYQGSVCVEYSDLETMQMLGRAGRPQFDHNAVAVIMTRLARVPHYEAMISGQEIVESCLHHNLIDHLNSEIGLSTINNASSAKKWLSGTFLYVRLKENPEHYKIGDDARALTLDDRLENICRKGIGSLEENGLVQSLPTLHCTEFGNAMARYYVQFNTMKVLLSLQPKAKISEILSALSQADEFKDVRFKSGEKSVYKNLNKNPSIKFPIPVNLDSPAHKVSLIIQSVLGAVELPSEEYKVRTEYSTGKSIIFQHAPRLIRCIIDCQLQLEDAVSVRNALVLARSLGAQVWDDSPLHMKQLDGVGLVSIRKLAVSGITSIEDIETAEPHRIEMAVSRNPPYGSQLQLKAKAFPKLRVSLKAARGPFVESQQVSINVKAEIGFLNEKPPETFNKKPVYVCFLAETSDGHKVHFARISAKKLSKGRDILFNVILTDASQTIRGYVMCDDLAGTSRHAVLNPQAPANLLPHKKSADTSDAQSGRSRDKDHSSNSQSVVPRRGSADDDFGDSGLNDADLANAEAGSFMDIDEMDCTGDTVALPKPLSSKNQGPPQKVKAVPDREAQQLSNGKWQCNHKCKNRTNCKHLCCKEGLDKPPKIKAKDTKQQDAATTEPRQTQLSLSATKASDHPATTKPRSATNGVVSKEAAALDSLHSKIQTLTPHVPTVNKRLAVDQVARPIKNHKIPRLDDSQDRKKPRKNASASVMWDSEDEVNSNPATQHYESLQYDPVDNSAGIDDMFDPLDEPFVQEQPQSPQNENENDDGIVDFSSYSSGFHTDEQDQRTDDLPVPKSIADHDFIEGLDVSSPRHTTQHHNIPPQQTPTADKTSQLEEVYDDDDLFEQFVEDGAAVGGPGDTASRGQHLTTDQIKTPVDSNTVFDGLTTGEGDANQGREETPDSVGDWFQAEFGTELFNYTG